MRYALFCALCLLIGVIVHLQAQLVYESTPTKTDMNHPTFRR